MKTLFTKERSFATLIIISVTFGLLAQNGQTKIIKKDFPVNANTKLELSNKYGNVNIVNTTDPTLTIEVNVKVNVRDKERGAAILEMVKIDISQEGDIVRAETQLRG